MGESPIIDGFELKEEGYCSINSKDKSMNHSEMFH